MDDKEKLEAEIRRTRIALLDLQKKKIEAEVEELEKTLSALRKNSETETSTGANSEPRMKCSSANSDVDAKQKIDSLNQPETAAKTNPKFSWLWILVIFATPLIIAIYVYSNSEQTAKNKNTTSKTQLIDAEGIGKCLGVISEIKLYSWPNMIYQEQLNYLKSHSDDVATIDKIDREQSACISRKQDISTCLETYSNYDRNLFSGYRSGRSFYAYARKNSSSTSIGAFLSACFD